MTYLISSSVQYSAGVKFEPDIDRRLSAKSNVLPSLTEDEIACIPRRAVVNPHHGLEIPAIVGWSVGPYLVNSRVRQIMESLTPATYRFVDIELNRYTADGRLVPWQTYGLVLNIPQIDAVVIEETDFFHGSGSDGFKHGGSFALNDGRITVNEDLTRGKCLWKLPFKFGMNEESGTRITGHFCSGEFWNTLAEEDLRGWHIERKCIVSRSLKC